MLLKLFKYDIKKLFKEVLPIYAFSIISIILLAFLSRFEYDSNFLTTVIYEFISVITFVLFIVVVLHSIYVVGTNIYQSVFKDQGYLTNTLPISKCTIILSKTLSGFIIITISGILSSTLIIASTFDSLGGIDFQLMSSSIENVNINPLVFTVLIISLFLVQTITLITGLFAALSLGHAHYKNKLRNSFLYAILMYIVFQVSTYIAIFYFVIINTLQDNVIIATESSPDLNDFKFQGVENTLIIMLVIMIVWNIIYYLLARNSLEKHLNID